MENDFIIECLKCGNKMKFSEFANIGGQINIDVDYDHNMTIVCDVCKNEVEL